MTLISTIGHILKTSGKDDSFGWGRAYCGEIWSEPFDKKGSWAKPGTIFCAFSIGYSRLCKRCVGAQVKEASKT